MKKFIFTCISAWTFCSAAQADILIGQTAGFSGAVAAGVAEISAGAMLFINEVNAKGGVNGQKIKIIQKDDQFKPDLASLNAKELIEKEGVIGLFLSRGTPHSEAILPLLNQHELALIAPSTGAMVLHSPVQKYVFNVRSTYQFEAEKTIEQLRSMMMSQIAVVHVDDSFGKDALAGYNLAFNKSNTKPVFVLTFDRQKPNFATVVITAAKMQPNAIVLAGSGAAVADGVTALRKSGWIGSIATLSNNASNGFIKLLGANAQGIIVSQVFPHERSLSSALIREMTALASINKVAITPSMVEGYAGAKVLVQALRGAGAKPTRASLLRSLNNLSMDLGELRLDFSEKDHTGVVFADLSIISASGVFRR